MSPQSLADDLAYVRDLAEAGQQAPLLGGRLFAWWGGLTTFAYLAHYAIAEGMFGLPPIALAFLWIGYAVIGLGGSFALQSTLSDAKPGASSTGNRVASLVWKAGGIFLGAYFAAAFLKTVTGDGSFDAFIASVPVVIGIYGLAQYVGGTIAGNRVMTLAGQGALIAMIPAMLLVGSNFAWLLGAGVAAICVLLPGIILMRNEPSNTI